MINLDICADLCAFKGSFLTFKGPFQLKLLWFSAAGIVQKSSQSLQMRRQNFYL